LDAGDARTVLGAAAAVDPGDPAVGADERVAAELQRVLVRRLGPAAAHHELCVACPDAGVQSDSEQGSAPESERVVGAPVGIAEDLDVVESLALLIAGH